MSRSGFRASTRRLERHLLVLECLQRRLPDPPQLSRKVGLPARSARITSVLARNPTRPSVSLLDAPGDGRADGKIILAAVAVQQHLECRQQGHVKRGPFASPRLLHAIGQRRRQLAA